jgi:N-carbamoylputrescine amidase
MKNYIMMAVITFMTLPLYLVAQTSTDDSDAKSSEIKVALLQMNSAGADLENSLKKGEEYCRRAKELGADIALFPEMWSVGYTEFHLPDATPEEINKNPLTFDSWKNKAIDKNSFYIKHFQKLAQELKMAIVITYLEKWNGLPRNSASLIDASGNILMTYAKVHTCDFTMLEVNTTPGDDFYVCNLPVNGKNVKIGMMICFDREIPESARVLMLKGAELILTPNACALGEMILNQFQTRAFENVVGVAMTNYALPNHNGHSCAYDAGGDKIIVGDDNEAVFIAKFDLDRIRKIRGSTIWGNTYRRPNKYKIITSMEVDSTFITKDARGDIFDRTKR